ncbi:MAG: hypothetical protein N3D12_04180 [Candidatus Methanomethyliaceae archaeon]|nr:hypothetical protein [Candidatus Methanomethyliaceae archaeon]
MSIYIMELYSRMMSFMINREGRSLWLASASLLLNAFLSISYLPMPVYYLSHKTMLTLSPPPILPSYSYPILSSALFLVAVFYSPIKDLAWRCALAVLVIAWAIPLGYDFLPPLFLIVGILYPYLHTRSLEKLWSPLVNLFSAIAIPLLLLSLLSFPFLKAGLPFFSYALWLNLSPTLLYPIITLASFLMAALSFLYVVIKRPAIPSLHKVSTKTSYKLTLLLPVALSVALSLIPHFPQVNPSWALVGVDSPHYIQYAEAVSSRTIGQSQVGPYYPFNTERSLTIILIYALSIVTDIEPAVKIFPVFLSALFTISTFFLARSIFRDDRVSALSAFFAATSFNLTAGYYSAILANWLSLSFAFLYFSLLLKDPCPPSPKRLLCLFVLLELSWLSHAWTWDFVLLISICYIFSLVIINRNPVHYLASNRYTILLIFASFTIDRIKPLFFGTGGAIEAGTAVSVRYLGAEYLLSSFKNMVFSFQFYVGGFYSNLLVVILTLAGLYLSFRHLDNQKLLLLCWTSVLAAPFLIIDLELIWRILYILPAPLICGYAISSSRSRTLYLTAIIWQINYVVYCLTALF